MASKNTPQEIAEEKARIIQGVKDVINSIRLDPSPENLSKHFDYDKHSLVFTSMIDHNSVLEFETCELQHSIDWAAQERANESRFSAGMGNVGKTGRTLVQLLEQNGTWQNVVDECFTFGFVNPSDIICDVIQQRGVDFIMNPEFRMLGVGCGPHPTRVYVCAIALLGGYGPTINAGGKTVHCDGGKEPSKQFLEWLQSIPDSEFQEEVLSQISCGCSASLSLSNESAVVTLTEPNGDIAQMEMTWGEE